MKIYTLILTCSCVAGLTVNSLAAPVGSSRPASQQNFQKLIKTNECPACDLAGVVLTRIDLSGANLEGANLAGAKLFLTDLSGANLKDANLQGAGLGGADLAGADLRGANLTGAVLEGAYLKGAQLDGQVVAASSYATEDLPDVSEKKYVAAPSRGKSAPYAQDAVVSDPQEMVAPPDAVPEVDQEVPEVAPSAGSKTLVPMADAVVRPPADDAVTDPPAEPQADAGDSAPADKDSDESGLWGSITSFFTGSSSESKEPEPVPVAQETAAPETEAPAQEVVVSSEELTVAEDIPVVSEPAPEPKAVEGVFKADAVPEVVVEEVTSPAEETPVIVEAVAVAEPEVVSPPEPTAPAEEQAQEEPVEDNESQGGFWDSVTSIFSSSDDGNKAEQEAEVKDTEPVASPENDVPVQTGKDELAADAGVRSMIEQIEGPPPTPEVNSQEDVAAGSGEEMSAEVDGAAVEPAAEVQDTDTEVVPPAAAEVGSAESPVAEEPVADESPAAEDTQPAAGSEVSAMIAQIEADPDVEPAEQGAMDYNVETPEQSLLKQQMILDRFHETERCVDCDLAGVDFSGKNMSGVDLERANLQGANLEGVDLGEANLKGVNFSGANLKDADLREADLYLADFTGADLSGARFEGALIDSTDFTDASGVNLEGAVKDE